jgi:hypothetical protein
MCQQQCCCLWLLCAGQARVYMTAQMYKTKQTGLLPGVGSQPAVARPACCHKFADMMPRKGMIVGVSAKLVPKVVDGTSQWADCWASGQ